MRLASGKESNFFIDCKQTVLGAEGHALAGQLMAEALLAWGDVQAVAGVELGGCPLASAVSMLSFQRGKPLDAVYVRKGAKDHGSQRVLEGNSHLAAGTRIALLEDVVTSGGSSICAAKKLTDGGYKLAGVLTLVDRCEGGGAAILEAGYRFEALFTRNDFVADG